MDRIVDDGMALPGPDFTPIVAIAMVQITSPNETFVLPQATIPLTSDDSMRGMIAKSANGGFRVERKVFHDADFDELGFRLKPNSIPPVSIILHGGTRWTRPETWTVNDDGRPIQAAARLEATEFPTLDILRNWPLRAVADDAPHLSTTQIDQAKNGGLPITGAPAGSLRDAAILWFSGPFWPATFFSGSSFLPEDYEFCRAASEPSAIWNPPAKREEDFWFSTSRTSRPTAASGFLFGGVDRKGRHLKTTSFFQPTGNAHSMQVSEASDHACCQIPPRPTPPQKHAKKRAQNQHTHDEPKSTGPGPGGYSTKQ